MSGSPGAHFLEVYLLSFIILEDKIQKLLESKGEKVNHKAFLMTFKHNLISNNKQVDQRASFGFQESSNEFQRITAVRP